jgi:hypothetical protein
VGRVFSNTLQVPPPVARGLGPTRHADWPRAEEAKPPRAVHATAQRLQAFLHFRPDQRVKGRSAMQAACNRAKWAHPSDFQRTQHGGPGPRVMQPVRRLLRASNCTAARTTTTPPRLRDQYRATRGNPAYDPAVPARRDGQYGQKWADSNGGGRRAGAAVTLSAKLMSHPRAVREPSLTA